MTTFLLQKEPSPEPAAPQDASKPKYERKKTVEKKEEPAKAEGEMLKLKKKTRVTPRKQIPPPEEDQPAFAGMKLKKATTVKRQWDDGGLEKVDLKHHEFEGIPQEEQVT